MLTVLTVLTVLNVLIFLHFRDCTAVKTEDLKKHELISYLPTDKLKARDASASKNREPSPVLQKFDALFHYAQKFCLRRGKRREKISLGNIICFRGGKRRKSNIILALCLKEALGEILNLILKHLTLNGH